jgi:Ca2+:H+ antiporter
VVALVIPSLFSSSIGPERSLKVEALSLGVAFMMIILYALGIFYSFKMSKGPLTAHTTKEPHLEQAKPDAGADIAAHHPTWTLRTALIVLAVSTVGVAYLSELLVGAVEPVVQKLGVSEFFLGII